MQGSNAEIAEYMRVQYGDVTVADDPFGFLSEAGEVELVNDPPCTITAPAAKDGMDAVVIKHGLKLMQPLLIASAEIIPGVAAQCFAHHHIKAPVLQRIDAGRRFRCIHITCGAGDANGIAFF